MKNIVKKANNFMETLKVKNFLLIKDAFFEVKKLNVIIGNQASGKSIISKLLFYFKEFISSSFLQSIEKDETRTSVLKDGLAQFIEYFPKYTWSSQEFELEYTFDDFVVSIQNLRRPSGRMSLKMHYSDTMNSLQIKCRKEYKQFLKNEMQDEASFLRQPFWNYRTKKLFANEAHSNKFGSSTFIPASRSFFANLQKSVFSFLASNIDIDPFMKKFGSRYENSKRLYKDIVFIDDDENKLVKEELEKLVEKILVGQYEYSDEKDWIKNKGTRINLANASSGQQEALPLLLILSSFPFFNPVGGRQFFFIEEPEAHLFPTAQKYIAQILVLLHSLNNAFVLTTHSPYILTALNNMILASDIRSKNTIKKLPNKFKSEFDLMFEDVSAYTIENGKLKSIMDEDNRLIGSSVIDNVSDVFEREFDELLAYT